MARSSIMIDLDDPRTQKIADVMANATCKKLLASLAERELSESELARLLGAPLNTVNYNMKKLVAAGLVEPIRSLWSSKGRAVKVYRVSQKKIVISPRTLTKGVLPAFAVAFIASLGIYLGNLPSQDASFAEGTSLAATAMEKSVDIVTTSGQTLGPLVSYAWLWFLLGAVIALATLSVWNWFNR